MSKLTRQEKFWRSQFGKDYTRRNHCKPKELDQLYMKAWGMTRSELNERYIGGKKINKVLEVGCNAGDQLGLLQAQGYKKLYGIEIQDDAIKIAKSWLDDVNIIQGSALDVPFKDRYFDLVFTSGVLIHIHPDDLPKVMSEIHRVSKKYIWGYESYSDHFQALDYRGNCDALWKGDYAQMYMEQFPDLKLLDHQENKFLDNDNIEAMFILEKTK